MNPERTGLTPATRKCFNAIEAHILRHGCSPSFEQIRQAIGLKSKGVVHRLVNDLVARGWITYRPGKKCSIVIVPSETAALTLPRHVETALKQYCARRGIEPAAGMADAVTAFISPDRMDIAA